MSKNTILYADGFNVKKPYDTAPEWVLGRLGVYAPAFNPWAEERATLDWLFLTITEGLPDDEGRTKFLVRQDTYPRKKYPPKPQVLNKSEFPAGINIFKPFDTAPDFVLANIGVYVPLFTRWVTDHANEKGYVNLDWLKSKDGKYYFKEDTYKKDQNNKVDDANVYSKTDTVPETSIVEDEDSSLPF